MGFWDFMNRMVNGRPVFDKRDFRDEDGNPVPVQGDIYPEKHTYSPRPEYKLPVDSHGREIYPILQIIQSGCHESGNEFLDLWITVRNTSDRLIELESVDILGQVQRCMHRFTPHQQRQIEVYKGPIPKDDSYKKAFLYYKEMQDGQYFTAPYLIQYHIEDSVRFLPMNFRLLQTVKNQ